NGALRRILAAVFIPICVALILRSGSRGQLIATGIAVLVALPIAFPLRGARSIAGMLLAGIFVAGMGWWASSLVEVDTSRWAGEQAMGDVTGRFANALTLLQASSSHFLTMIFGLGNSSAFKLLGVYPHITGLEVIAEEGILGAALYFA